LPRAVQMKILSPTDQVHHFARNLASLSIRAAIEAENVHV